MIFDGVITGFGRLGTPFAADYFGVVPDIICAAKGLTNGIIPMGAVIVKDEIYTEFMTGPKDTIELFHGYTYSGIPCSVAAGLAMQEIFEKEDLINRSKEMSPYFLDSLFTLKDIDGIRSADGGSQSASTSPSGVDACVTPSKIVDAAIAITKFPRVDILQIVRRRVV